MSEQGSAIVLMPYAISFIVTVAVIIVLQRYASALNLTTEPGGHRAHTGDTPLVGGIGMFLGLTCGLVLASGPWALLVCALIVVVAGVWDDMHELSTGIRIFAQIVACTVMIFWGQVVLFDLGYLVSGENIFYLGRWAVALTIFGSVGVMNAINMSDGMDGLAGSLTFISAGAVMMAAIYAGMTQSAIELGVFLSVTGAFLLFNIRYSNNKPARIFMGDAGSTLLGLILAWYLIKHTQEPNKLFTPVTALWIAAMPLFDAVGVLIRRILKGGSPFNADRSHYHHYLIARGFTVNQVLLTSSGISLLFVAIGLAANYVGVPERVMFFSFLLLFSGYLALLERMERKLDLNID